MSQDIEVIGDSVHLKKDATVSSATPGLTITLNIGASDRLVINKEFGPCCAASLRIHCDVQRGWVIEREIIQATQFVGWCVIPIQIDLDFPADEKSEVRG